MREIVDNGIMAKTLEDIRIIYGERSANSAGTNDCAAACPYRTTMRRLMSAIVCNSLMQVFSAPTLDRSTVSSATTSRKFGQNDNKYLWG
jgi:hypothetical protein